MNSWVAVDQSDFRRNFGAQTPRTQRPAAHNERSSGPDCKKDHDAESAAEKLSSVAGGRRRCVRRPWVLPGQKNASINSSPSPRRRSGDSHDRSELGSSKKTASTRRKQRSRACLCAFTHAYTLVMFLFYLSQATPTASSCSSSRIFIYLRFSRIVYGDSSHFYPRIPECTAGHVQVDPSELKSCYALMISSGKGDGKIGSASRMQALR